MGIYYLYRTGFLLYGVMCLYTVWAFALTQAGSFYQSLTFILWTIMGLYKGLYFIQLHLPLPAILTLPSRILFGRYYVQHKNKLLLSDNFVALPFLLLLAGVLLYWVWGVFTLFYPAPVFLFEQFWQSKDRTSVDEISIYRLIYIMIEQASWLVMGVMMVFLALSLALPPFQRLLWMGGASLFMLVLFIFHYRAVGFADFSFYQAMTHGRGMGWGWFEDYNRLAGHTQGQASAFTQRYAELGLIGALFPYVTLFVVAIAGKYGDIQKYAMPGIVIGCSLLCVLLIVIQDIGLAYHSYGVAGGCLFWAVIGFFFSYQRIRES